MSLMQLSGPQLNDEPRPGLVRLLCGVAGAGKTTYAQRLEARGFVRLSIDEEIWRRFGRYGVDYEPGDYASHQPLAEQSLREELVRLMRDKTPVVVERSFWQRSTRDQYKALITLHGCEWDLVHLQVDEATLRERLRHRAQRFDANAAFPITEDLLGVFLRGFETPVGEGEIVLHWRSGTDPGQRSDHSAVS